MNIDEIIEDIFSNAEKNIPGYKRPADYKERAIKLLNKKYNPAHLEEK